MDKGGNRQHSHPAVPAGAPAWITPEIVADTIETWQPYYAVPLTVADSLEILQSVSRLLDALQEQARMEG
jgi:hypothetical protein